ncbi:MAG: GMP/IMP nucleotidase [Gammaproteobacteria bacterium]
MQLPWSDIDSVFLDMDGTLLDLNFDNQFWLHHVPLRYGQINGMTKDEAWEALAPRFRAVEGTLDWYCLDYWSRELDLDIALLKEEVDHLIAVHPHVLEFLDAVRALGKRVVLVTNAHMKSLALKMRKTRLDGHLDAMITSHDLGLAKEADGFWDKLNAVEPYDRARTLFCDDSLAVLESARRGGLKHLVAIRLADSKGEPRPTGDFDAIDDFREIMPPR